MTVEIANRLVLLRKAANLSQEDLAEKLSISRQAVSKWERAESSPDTDNLIALAALYNVTLDELLFSEHAIPTLQEQDIADDRGTDEEERSYFRQKEAEAADSKPNANNKSFWDVVNYPMLVVFIYLCIGFAFNLWHPGWLIFLTIPLHYLPDHLRKPRKLLTSPIMITIVYLILGIYVNLWHPGWLIFLAVPLFAHFES